MKWIYRLFTFAILGAALSVPFFMNNKDGDKMLSLPKVGDLMPSKDDSISKVINNTTTVFKWQDAQGGWHYGDQPPADAKNISTLTIHNNVNVVQAVKTEDPEASAPAGTDQAPGYTPIGSDEEVLTLERAQNILNETREVAKAMEARNSTLDALVGEKEK